MSITLIGAILGSSVLTALVTQFFLKWKADKQISIENITHERKEWRIRLRELLVELIEAVDKKDRLTARKIEAELIVRLNPEDKEDLKILNLFPSIYQDWNEEAIRELSDRLSYLLKHDWERVKGEINGGFNVYSFLSASIIALFSVYMFFYVLDFWSVEKELKLTTTTMYFGGWLVFTVFIVCAVDFVFKKTTSSKSNNQIVGLFERLPYRSRDTRRQDNS
ncbi:hypothetical protein BCU33_018040 [Vibrio lentus]|uniref:hypothetical protein n=1 Tax=Vibrio lentus TaxID=136468 RepID=UPI000C819BCD|nr:hypothetical protein [Vibrio lentus]PMI94950.1 hypothetical protein BCU33_16175 [Vibrio lentus]